ncbi:MAG: hypothetical protein ACXVJK_01030 [Candidatus Aminicenantales bacterium]
MRTERLAPVLAILCLASYLASSPQETRAKKNPDQIAGKSKPIVRKDLLVFGKGQILPPRRDIFRPGFYGMPASAPMIAVRPARKSLPPKVEEPPAFVLNLVYVGSVRSSGKIVALVIRDGQTMSVAEGDEVVPGYKVVRVTPDEIEVEGPNSERKTFSRQGDRP